MDKQVREDAVFEAGFSRERYQTPVLRLLGDIREITLGGSLGVGDSTGTPPNQRL